MQHTIPKKMIKKKQQKSFSTLKKLLKSTSIIIKKNL